MSGRAKPPSPWATTSDSTSCSQVGASRKFTNPGPAISTAATPVGLTGWTITEGAGQPVIAGDYDAASVLGQSAIVSHSDDTFTEWAAASLSPLKWLPRTAGILYNRDTFQWERMFIDDGTIQTEILPDQ